MKSLAGLMKEIKNNPTLGPFNQINHSDANYCNQKIDTMISTLDKQGSAMKGEKMAALIGLKEQLTKITVKNQPKEVVDTSRRNKLAADQKSEKENAAISNRHSNVKLPKEASHRQDSM
ncbi:hypothetical protein AB8989_01550 [Yersinia hibernica]|uniref:Uncharacterized protein n=1 Tax=Yersinia hibernica TaxID=2339259 RepID=A0ABX5QXV3_9GAMM|nr:hypothetical protein [Yersinia hibernica]QAX78212.1 hypothetical protein D5F51_06370 [Yersinia hibernica]